MMFVRSFGATAAVYREEKSRLRKIRHSRGRCCSKRSMQTLLIDNYDSYTYNLYQLIAKTNRCEPLVILNDVMTVEEVKEMIERKGIESIVISPGPGGPDNPKDTGICSELFRHFPTVPILGVCLGHQILASVYGGVTRRVTPVHGRLSGIVHNGHPLFAKIPSSVADFQVVRYHSLAVDESELPSCLELIAWTCGGSHTLKSEKVGNQQERVVMGLAHLKNPHYGVQFHPESIGTFYGERLFTNFRSLIQQQTEEQHRNTIPFRIPEKRRSMDETSDNPTSLKIVWKKLDGIASRRDSDFDGLFDVLYSDAEFEDTFWLDSAGRERCRFSFMGGPGGHLWRKITYRLTSSTGGTATIIDRKGTKEMWSGSIWTFLKKQLQRQRASSPPELPFDFCGGFVGYLGYELKALCGGKHAHASSTPDAALFFADCLVAIDHKMGDVYCLGIYETDSDKERRNTESWIASTSDTVSRFFDKKAPETHSEESVTPVGCGFVLDRDQLQYQRDVKSCMEYLRSGNSYEICLTNKFRKRRAPLSDRVLYRRLRRRNPAPYAAWLKFGRGDVALTVCCSSPERFLKGDRNRTLEAKPIKGTFARSNDPTIDRAAARELKNSEKNQAENMMIVDLLRNDLGRVCEPSSVHVPALMEVESFTTVHQLVSTVHGTRRRDISIIDAIKAAFPGGSMTGAPKIRTMEILDTLEGAARGIYSGCIGYLSVTETFDLNIVIRTAVLTNDEILIGSGGAIVLQSDAADEFSEMKLKAFALLEAVDQWEAA